MKDGKLVCVKAGADTAGCPSEGRHVGLPLQDMTICPLVKNPPYVEHLGI